MATYPALMPLKSPRRGLLQAAAVSVQVPFSNGGTRFRHGHPRPHTRGGSAPSLTTVSLGPLALAVVLHLAKIVAEARSWHNILVHSYPRSGLRFRTTLGAFMGMIGANAVLPARIGTALRLGIVRRRIPGSSVATIASTIVLETAIELAFGVAVILTVLLGGRSLGQLGPGAGVLTLAAHPLAPAVVGLLGAGLSSSHSSSGPGFAGLRPRWRRAWQS